ncbi:hypothetical protein EG346_17700 [Chryseobacterium carnipullorum]|uniref:Uncharacterized protein n=1 Tax=Chryseobacterium carnipullorum TaxID=1124835 RepID=A0A3G6NIJ0_CHRCU|nr:hypothetical protein EG346_17700 [Chryseobacterium carnipullorum]AZA64779.1 hypothetical protein EG345_08725 [Chryseobacterium carnipullorum]
MYVLSQLTCFHSEKSTFVLTLNFNVYKFQQTSSMLADTVWIISTDTVIESENEKYGCFTFF